MFKQGDSYDKNELWLLSTNFTAQCVLFVCLNDTHREKLQDQLNTRICKDFLTAWLLLIDLFRIFT